MRDLVLISDLHLGSHLKPRTRGEFVHLAAKIEDSFPAFLDHYTRAGRWQLVINGDFIDFWNIELGGDREDPEQVAVARLHAVLDTHPGVEDALVRFLDAGNGIVFVTGNHDAEFLYPAVRKALAARLEGAMAVEDASITRTGMTRLDGLEAGRVRFVPWFLREEGGAWIEHGHMFDAACTTSSPLSPTRGGQLVQTVAEVATRTFTNLMPEIDYDAPDKWGLADYGRWAVSRGIRFLMRALLLYLRMAGHMIALWARSGRVDREARALHDERLAKVAANAGLQMSALTALERMAPPPSSASVGGVLSVIALDYLLSILASILVVPLLGRAIGLPLWVGVPLGLGVAIASVWGIRRRRKPRNVYRDQLSVAASIGQVTEVPLVLMGHSHNATLERVGDVVYGNSGSWLDGSHLTVLRDESGRLSRAELRRWRNGGVTVQRQLFVPSFGTAPALEGTGDLAPAGLSSSSLEGVAVTPAAVSAGGESC